MFGDGTGEPARMITDDTEQTLCIVRTLVEQGEATGVKFLDVTCL